MGRKLGDNCAPLKERELGPYLTQCRLAEAYLRTKWQYPDTHSRLATMDMGRKLWAVSPFWAGGAGSPFTTTANHVLYELNAITL